MTKEYDIAGFRIRITGGDWLPSAGGFGRALEVFETTACSSEAPLFTLHTNHEETPDKEGFQETDAFDFPEVGARCRLLHNSAGRLLTMQGSGQCARFFLPFNGGEAFSNVALGIPAPHTPSFFRFGLWMLFGLAANAHLTIPIHSSTVCHKGGGVLFLGESGTGKSTHTQLWIKHIPGTSLLNDDSPVIRLCDGVPTVYGTPWSGKMPCYKNESHPIRALVRLSQAPYNAIRRLPVISAIGALLPSCPPSFAFDDRLQDRECDTLSQVIARVPVYHLECLPDKAAAELSYHTVFGR